MDDVKNQQPEQPHVVGYMPDSPDGEPLITLESHEEFVSKLMQPGLETWQKGRDGMREERDAQRLRADTAEAELERAECMRESYKIDAGIYREKLAAAEQRIAELSADNQQLRKLLEQTLAALNPTAKLSKSIRAALNPKPEAGSHD
jgi:hypothetical protein